MKKLNYFLITVFVSVLFACHKPKPAPIPVKETSLSIKIEDGKGNNLIGTKQYGDSIEIYHLYPCGHIVFDYINVEKKGKIKTGYRISKNNISVDIGRGESITSHIDDGKIVPPYELKHGQTFTTYIKWNSKDTDTIIATFLGKEGFDDTSIPAYMEYIIAYDKVYYNGELVVKSYKEIMPWQKGINIHGITIIK